ncbi:unnamed protein product, partial [marine sediment metagenome]
GAWDLRREFWEDIVPEIVERAGLLPRPVL